MASECLFGCKDRDESHKELERVIKRGEYKRAECREYPNDLHPYQVWSGPQSEDPK